MLIETQYYINVIICILVTVNHEKAATLEFCLLFARATVLIITQLANIKWRLNGVTSDGPLLRLVQVRLTSLRNLQ